MDAEKSSSSSFEDLSNLNEADMKAASEQLLEQERRAEGVTAGIAANVAAAAVVVGEGSAEEPKAKEPAVDSDSDSGAPASVGDDEPCDVLGNGQLVKRVLKKSKNNKRPVRGDLVTLSYTAKLEDGTVVEQQENCQVHVGDFEVR